MQVCLVYTRIVHNTKTISKDMGHENKPGQRSCIFSKLPFSLLVFPDENNIEKLVGDMWGNYFDIKRIQRGFFPANFVKFLRTPFFTEHLWTTDPWFFHSFHCFFCHPVI